MNWEPELPLAPAKKKLDVAEGLGIEKGDGLLLMGIPRGSFKKRVAEELANCVSVGGRSVEIGNV